MERAVVLNLGEVVQTQILFQNLLARANRIGLEFNFHCLVKVELFDRLDVLVKLRVRHIHDDRTLDTSQVEKAIDEPSRVFFQGSFNNLNLFGRYLAFPVSGLRLNCCISRRLIPEGDTLDH
jgi:hypothetical protein